MSSWKVLLFCVLQSQAYKQAKYVAAGPEVETIKVLNPEIDHKRDPTVPYAVEAGLLNLDRKPFIKALFILPGKVPKGIATDYRAIFNQEHGFYSVRPKGNSTCEDLDKIMINYLVNHLPQVAATLEPQPEVLDKQTTSTSATKEDPSIPVEKTSCRFEDVEKSEPLDVVHEIDEQTGSRTSSSTDSEISSVVDSTTTASSPMSPTLTTLNSNLTVKTARVDGLSLLQDTLLSTCCPLFTTPLDTIKSGWPSSWLETRFWNDANVEDYLNKRQDEDKILVEHFGIDTLYQRNIPQQKAHFWLDLEERSNIVMRIRQMEITIKSDEVHDDPQQDGSGKPDNDTTNDDSAKENSAEMKTMNEHVGMQIAPVESTFDENTTGGMMMEELSDEDLVIKKPTIKEPAIIERKVHQSTTEEFSNEQPAVEEINTSCKLWLNPGTIIYPCCGSSVSLSEEISVAEKIPEHPVENKVVERVPASNALWLNPETIIYPCKNHSFHAEETETKQKVAEVENANNHVTEKDANSRGLWLNPETTIDTRFCHPVLDTGEVTEEHDALKDNVVTNNTTGDHIVDGKSTPCILWISPGIQIDIRPCSLVSYSEKVTVKEIVEEKNIFNKHTEENVVEDTMILDKFVEESSVDANAARDNVEEKGVFQEAGFEESGTEQSKDAENFVKENLPEEQVAEENIAEKYFFKGNVTRADRGNDEDVEENTAEERVDKEKIAKDIDAEEGIIPDDLLDESSIEANVFRDDTEQDNMVEEHELAVEDNDAGGGNTEEKLVEEHLSEERVVEDRIAEKSINEEQTSEGYVSEENIGKEDVRGGDVDEGNIAKENNVNMTLTDETDFEQRQSEPRAVQMKIILLLWVVLLWVLW